MLTPEAKSVIFRIEAAVEMNFVVQAWSVNVRTPANPVTPVACCPMLAGMHSHPPSPLIHPFCGTMDSQAFMLAILLLMMLRSHKLSLSHAGRPACVRVLTDIERQ